MGELGVNGDGGVRGRNIWPHLGGNMKSARQQNGHISASAEPSGPAGSSAGHVSGAAAHSSPFTSAVSGGSYGKPSGSPSTVKKAMKSLANAFNKKNKAPKVPPRDPVSSDGEFKSPSGGMSHAIYENLEAEDRVVLDGFDESESSTDDVEESVYERPDASGSEVMDMMYGGSDSGYEAMSPVKEDEGGYEAMGGAGEEEEPLYEALPGEEEEPLYESLDKIDERSNGHGGGRRGSPPPLPPARQ